MPPNAPSRIQPAPAPRALPHIDRIVLTGFMGSGKTTAGALLANLLGWRFLDLDHEIERRDGRSVPEIFAAPGATGGEPHFRRLETSALASLLGQRNIVLALGGGAPEHLGNRLLLEQTPRTAVVYLAAPFQTLLDRCAAQAADPTSTARPVLADIALAEQRFRLRQPHYQRIASHTLDTSTLAPTQISDAILNLLQARNA
ncbi:MAG: shikimate kinase [Acidobacteria bacterium]|nr:shikimate kinase [Acidobacteriota bacterium]